LIHEIISLQGQITKLRAQAPQVKEVEKGVVPLEIKAQLETLHQQVRTLKEQRDALARRVTQLAEEARTEAQKHQSEQERRIRLNWYRVTIVTFVKDKYTCLSKTAFPWRDSP
jgi:chromosome segregation ATPase